MNKAMLLKQYMFNNKKKSARLPSAYQEVEYIQGTGTQYINTLVIPTSKTSWEIEFEQTEKKSVWYFGVDTGWVTNGFGFNVYKKELTTDIYPLLYINSSTYADFEKIEANQRYVVKYGNGLLRVNSTEYSVPSFTGTLTNPIYTNSINRNGTPDSIAQGKGKIYSLKFYEDNTIIRDFVPCYRKSDNEVGLYDIVNNQFYTNQGTGSFLCGRPLVNIDGYEQLDYIESSGTQYIDTGLNWDNGYKMKCSVLCSESSSSTDMSLCGCRLSNNWLSTSIVTSAYNWKAEYFANSGSKFQIAYNTSWLLSSDTITANVFYNFESYLGEGEQYLKVNGETKISNTIASQGYAEYLRTTKLLIFGRSGEHSDKNLPSQLFKGKLKFFKIFLNDVLQRDYIPMRRKLDGELGLYDLVNNQFYTNSGSGTFIAGEVLKA